MKIGILGTRGIPNQYGGFEQFAEFLSKGLVERGEEVYVYNSHNHIYQEPEWNGVKIIHCNDPEHKFGTFGQFIYDYNCIADSRKRNFDIILQLGYTSSSVWGWRLPRKSIIATNMDGLEWKRTKYSRPVQKFLKFAEWLGVRFSDFLIADSLGIKNYLKKEYGSDSVYIPYGAEIFNRPAEKILSSYSLAPYSYDMLMARLEPENSIEIILDGVTQSSSRRDFIVVGKHATAYGEYLKKKYTDKRIRFLGGIYDKEAVNNLRCFSNLYFHGHTVGGTNPSLLEAMGTSCLICANKNDFNAYILGEDAYYFTNANEVASLCSSVARSDAEQRKIAGNLEKVSTLYSWDKIIEDYHSFLLSLPGRIKK